MWAFVPSLAAHRGTSTGIRHEYILSFLLSLFSRFFRLLYGTYDCFPLCIGSCFLTTLVAERPVHGHAGEGDGRKREAGAKSGERHRNRGKYVLRYGSAEGLPVSRMIV